jgi:FtsZ-binding cell division protein ZapB
MKIELFDIAVSIAGFFSAYYVKQLADAIKEAVQSIKDLNQKVAVIIERTETHSHEIQILREKQDNLQSDVAHIKAHIK